MSTLSSPQGIRESLRACEQSLDYLVDLHEKNATQESLTEPTARALLESKALRLELSIAPRLLMASRQALENLRRQLASVQHGSFSVDSLVKFKEQLESLEASLAFSQRRDSQRGVRDPFPDALDLGEASRSRPKATQSLYPSGALLVRDRIRTATGPPSVMLGTHRSWWGAMRNYYRNEEGVAEESLAVYDKIYSFLVDPARGPGGEDYFAATDAWVLLNRLESESQLSVLQEAFMYAKRELHKTSRDAGEYALRKSGTLPDTEVDQKLKRALLVMFRPK